MNELARSDPFYRHGEESGSCLSGEKYQLFEQPSLVSFLSLFCFWSRGARLRETCSPSLNGSLPCLVPRRSNIALLPPEDDPAVTVSARVVRRNNSRRLLGQTGSNDRCSCRRSLSHPSKFVYGSLSGRNVLTAHFAVLITSRIIHR